jgi:predicted DNA-binding helix-hairpin-helix protein
MDTLQRVMEISSLMDVEVASEPTASPTGRPPVDDADVSPASSIPTARRVCAADAFPIQMAVMPNGQRMPLLKSAMTTVCENHCLYCAFRAGRDFFRQTFSPDEMAQAVVELTQSGIIRGAFLSSGVSGSRLHTQDQILAAAEVLRLKKGYQGYLHIKIMPGAEKAQVERAVQLADRVSVNLEAPTIESLHRIAPEKHLAEELLAPLRWVETIRQNQPAWKNWKGRMPSSSTQFVVGCAGESDLQYLQAAAYLHQKLKLARVYYSSFNPIRDTPFENLPPSNPWREHRLYQASFLLRDYGYDVEDFVFNTTGNLPLKEDPKLAWARLHLSEAPLDVNFADEQQLLRVPGFGPRGVKAILAARRKNPFKRVEDLRRAGVQTSRAAPFILLNGRRPVFQMALWD